MSSFVYSLLADLDGRWREVDLLLDRAEVENSCGSVEFHDALCRAAVVLCVAHLEGYVRDLARAVISDMNKFSSFSKLTPAIKRTYCSAFVVANDGDSNQRVEKLMQVFDGLATQLDVQPFLFGGKFDDHKNPTPRVIERICVNLGVKSPFKLLADSKLDEVFGILSTADADRLCVELGTALQVYSDVFPYQCDAAKYGVDHPGKIAGNGRTLWEAFLDDVLKRRHDIAHGSSQDNGQSVAEIRSDKTKNP